MVDLRLELELGESRQEWRRSLQPKSSVQYLLRLRQPHSSDREQRLTQLSLQSVSTATKSALVMTLVSMDTAA